MRRVQRDQSKEHIVEFLAKGEKAPFKDIWRLLLFSAALGKKHDRKVSLTTIDSGKSMPQTYFDTATAWPGFQHLLAIVDTEDPSILSGSEIADDKRLTLFEEYANGGLAILSEKLEASSYSLDALVKFVASEVVDNRAPDGLADDIVF